MLITPEKFVLTSPLWNDDNPDAERGMKIDLTGGSITNYGKFKLKAADNSGSFVSLSSEGDSTDGFFRIHRVYGVNNSKTMDLVRITNSVF
jgi:hypothetical protein